MCALCIHIINIPCVHCIKVLKDVEVFQKQHKASRCCYAAGTTALRVRRGSITIFFLWLMFHMSASLKSHRTLRWWLAWHQWESGKMFVVAQTENSYIICCLSFVLLNVFVKHWSHNTFTTNFTIDLAFFCWCLHLSCRLLVENMFCFGVCLFFCFYSISILKSFVFSDFFFSLESSWGSTTCEQFQDPVKCLVLPEANYR